MATVDRKLTVQEYQERKEREALLAKKKKEKQEEMPPAEARRHDEQVTPKKGDRLPPTEEDERKAKDNDIASDSDDVPMGKKPFSPNEMESPEPYGSPDFSRERSRSRSRSRSRQRDYAPNRGEPARSRSSSLEARRRANSQVKKEGRRHSNENDDDDDWWTYPYDFITEVDDRWCPNVPDPIVTNATNESEEAVAMRRQPYIRPWMPPVAALSILNGTRVRDYPIAIFDATELHPFMDLSWELHETRRKAYLVDAFFQHRYYKNRCRIKPVLDRTFVSEAQTYAIAQAWNMFVQNIKRVGFDRWMDKFQRDVMRSEQHSLIASKIRVHWESRVCGVPCCVSDNASCPMCLPDGPCAPDVVHTYDDQGWNHRLTTRLRDAIEKCDGLLERSGVSVGPPRGQRYDRDDRVVSTAYVNSPVRMASPTRMASPSRTAVRGQGRLGAGSRVAPSYQKTVENPSTERGTDDAFDYRPSDRDESEGARRSSGQSRSSRPVAPVAEGRRDPPSVNRQNDVERMHRLALEAKLQAEMAQLRSDYQAELDQLHDELARLQETVRILTPSYWWYGRRRPT